MIRDRQRGEFEAKNQRMISYLKEVKIPKCQFKKMEILHISRGNNSHVDSLATLASSMADPLPRIASVELEDKKFHLKHVDSLTRISS